MTEKNYPLEIDYSLILSMTWKQYKLFKNFQICDISNLYRKRKNNVVVVIDFAQMKHEVKYRVENFKVEVFKEYLKISGNVDYEARISFVSEWDTRIFDVPKEFTELIGQLKCPLTISYTLV